MMEDEKALLDISFNNMRINRIGSTSGIFAGRNLQHLWLSDSATLTGFGFVNGEGNTLEKPFNVVTDPNSSSELLEYFEESARAKIGKRGI